MKKRYIGVLLLCAILAFMGGYLWQTTHKLGDMVYSVAKVADGDSSKDKYEISYEYPVIASGIPEIAKNKINSDMEAWAKSNASSTKSDFMDMLKDPMLTRSDLGLTYMSKVTVKNDFKTLPYINISFETYTYSGGAHGITVVNTFVYDAKTGEKVTLDNVLTGDYLNALSTLSLAELKKKDPNLETYNFALDGTKPVAENFGTWTLEGDGLHIVFSDYQVGPYVVGRPEVVISYNDLKGVMVKNSPIYFLAH